MLRESFFTSYSDLPVATDRAVPPAQSTDVERLALTLLKIAEKFEVEAGLELQITPAMPIEALAAVAGIDETTTTLLLGHLLQSGIIAQRRQRFVLTEPKVLYSLALGAPPG